MLGDMRRQYVLQRFKDRNTRELLKKITSHLSYRPECKNAEYILVIRDGSISFSHDLYVYKDRYNRNDANRDTLIEHIIKYHFNMECSMKDGVKIYPDIFISGIYTYSTFGVSKRRKWNYQNVNRYTS